MSKLEKIKTEQGYKHFKTKFLNLCNNINSYRYCGFASSVGLQANYMVNNLLFRCLYKYKMHRR